MYTVAAMAENIISRRNDLHRRIQDQGRLLSKLQNERQTASPPDRDRYDRDIQVVSEDIRRLNVLLEGLKDDSAER